MHLPGLVLKPKERVPNSGDTPWWLWRIPVTSSSTILGKHQKNHTASTTSPSTAIGNDTILECIVPFLPSESSACKLALVRSCPSVAEDMWSNQDIQSSTDTSPRTRTTAILAPTSSQKFHPSKQVWLWREARFRCAWQRPYCFLDISNNGTIYIPFCRHRRFLRPMRQQCLFVALDFRPCRLSACGNGIHPQRPSSIARSHFQQLDDSDNTFLASRRCHLHIHRHLRLHQV